MSHALLSTHDIVKRFGQVPALAGISLRIDPGETVAIMGPSGSGKSTLLHCLSGVLTPQAGTVMFNDRNLSGLNDTQRSRIRLHNFGFVFQDGQLLPELPARENVALPLMLTGGSTSVALQAADQMLGQLGLAELRHRRPSDMSGGQAQRVAVARALVARPRWSLPTNPPARSTRPPATR